MRVALIGCGAMGQKRAKHLSDCELIFCVDPIKEKASALALQFPNCRALTDWREAVNSPDVDIIIISTLHAYLAEISHAAVAAGKHILVEKPGGCKAQEIDKIISSQENKNIVACVGFNHRYHRALQKARALIDADELGELMFIRGRYGHGGRIGYDKEWRATPELSGGGELIDQGVHLIDLARWFLGDFVEVSGFAHTYYWDMPVDDNSFLILKTAKNQIAHLHASCTEWKNTFSFEIYGRKGKIDINGLGGSYGVERISFYKMLPMMGPPETTIWEYPMPDNSWELEFSSFVDSIKQQSPAQASLHDARAALHIVEEIYRVSKL